MKNAKKNYHTHNLKEKLLDEALNEISKNGIESLSLRSLSKNLNVSHAAPYRHFESKDDLFNQLALKGLSIFESHLEKSIDQNFDSYQEKIKVFTKCYMNFVIENQAYYEVMINLDLIVKNKNEAVNKQGSKVFEILLNLLKEGQVLGIVKQENPLILGISLWAIFHGLIDLFLKKHICKDLLVEFPEYLDGTNENPWEEELLKNKTYEAILNIFLKGIQK